MGGGQSSNLRFWWKEEENKILVVSVGWKSFFGKVFLISIDLLQPICESGGSLADWGGSKSLESSFQKEFLGIGGGGNR